MFAPHHTENAQLRDGGFAAQELADFAVLLGGQAVLAQDLRRNGSRADDRAHFWTRGSSIFSWRSELRSGMSHLGQPKRKAGPSALKRLRMTKRVGIGFGILTVCG